MDKEELKRATSRMGLKRVTELPPIIRRNMKAIFETGEEKPEIRKNLNRMSRVKVIPANTMKVERKKMTVSTQKYPSSESSEEEKGGTEHEMKQTAGNLSLKKKQSEWLRDRKSGSIELKGRENQEKKIAIDTQYDPEEDQLQFQAKARKGYFSIVLVIAVILFVILIDLIGYVIYLQRKSTDYKEKNSYLARTNINQFEHCNAQIFSSKNRMNHFSDKTRQKIFAQQEQLISFTNLIKLMKEYSIVQATEELVLYMNYIKAKETVNINKDEIYYVKVQNSNKKEELIQKENEISALQLQLHNSQYKNYWLKDRYQLGKLDNQYLIQRNYQQKEYYTEQIYSGKNRKINVYKENSRKIYIYEHMLDYYSESLKVKDQINNNQENKRESIQANTSVIKYSWLKNKYEALERDNEYLKQRNEYQIEYYSGQIYRVKNDQTNLYHTNRLKLLVYELIFLDYSNSLKLLKEYINNHQESHISQINSSQNQNYHWLKRKNQLMQSDKHYLARTNINQLEHCTAQIYSSKNRMNHFSEKTRQKIFAQQEQLISFTNLIKVMKEYSIVQATEELVLYMNYIKAKETVNINKDEIYYVKVQNSNYQSMLQYFAHLYYDMHYSRINITLKEEIILLEDRIIDLNFQLNYSQNNIVCLKSRYQQIVGDNLYLAQGNADLKNDYSKNIFSLKVIKINKDHEYIQKLYIQGQWLRYYLSTIKEAKTKLNNQFNRGPILYSEYSSIKESNLQLKYKYLNRISEVIPSQHIFSLKTIETSNISRLIQDQAIIAQLTEDIKLLRNELAMINSKVTYRGLYNVEDLIQNLKNLLTSIKYKRIAEIFTLEEEKSELIRSLKVQKYERSIEMYYQIYQREEILELREKIEHLVDIIKKNKEEHIPKFNSIKYLRDEYISCENSNIQGADRTEALINELYIKTEQIANLQTERRKIEIYKNNLREMAGSDQFLHQLKINKIVQMGITEYEIIFWSVHEYGILGWIEQGGSYTPSLLSISSGYKHYKGEYNPDGYYVVGSTSGRPIVYNMKTAQLHKVYSGNYNNVYDCAWQNTTHFVCCDGSEDALFYEMSTTNSLSKWSPGGDDKKAIIVLISGAVVVGDKDSDLDIKITTNSYSSNTANEDDVYGLAEVRPNMVISAEDDQLYLHNFTTPTDIRRTKL